MKLSYALLVLTLATGCSDRCDWNGGAPFDTQQSYYTVTKNGNIWFVTGCRKIAQLASKECGAKIPEIPNGTTDSVRFFCEAD